LPDLLVIGNDDSGIRIVTAKNHVAAALAAKEESGTFQGTSHFSSREIGRKLSHLPIPA